MPPNSDSIEWVSKPIIRQIFNEYKFAEKAAHGEFRTEIKRNSHLNSPPASEPYCTNSQIIMYFNEDEVVAIVHQYLRPDGTLGGSGKPDPKRLILGDRILSIRSDEK